jgi:hypothetical protein
MGSLARVLFTGEGEGGGGGFKSGAGDDSPVVGSGQEVEGCEAGRCCTLLLGQAIAGKENGEGGGGLSRRFSMQRGEKRSREVWRCVHVEGRAGRSACAQQGKGCLALARVRRR